MIWCIVLSEPVMDLYHCADCDVTVDWMLLAIVAGDGGDCDMLPSPTGSVGVDWNPITAAPAQSAFIAVLAGFVFIGIVHLLTDRERRYSGSTLVLFIAAFLCLAAGSYLGSLVSGEVACLRAWSESMFVSGLLAVGVVAMLCGLAWLIPDHLGAHRPTRWFVMTSVLLVALVVTELLTTTARGYILDNPVKPVWRDIATWYVLAMPAIIVAFLARNIAHRGGAQRISGYQQAAVTVAGGVILIYVLGSLAVLGFISDRPANLWNPPATWVITVTLLVPMTGAAIAIAAAVHALPTKQTWPDRNPLIQPSDEESHHTK